MVRAPFVTKWLRCTGVDAGRRCVLNQAPSTHLCGKVRRSSLVHQDCVYQIEGMLRQSALIHLGGYDPPRRMHIDLRGE